MSRKIDQLSRWLTENTGTRYGITELWGVIMCIHKCECVRDFLQYFAATISADVWHCKLPPSAYSCSTCMQPLWLSMILYVGKYVADILANHPDFPGRLFDICHTFSSFGHHSLLPASHKCVVCGSVAAHPPQWARDGQKTWRGGKIFITTSDALKRISISFRKV